MNNYEINHILKYLSLALILSYFIVHKIILVLIGIILSWYIINIDLINGFVKSTNQRLETTKRISELKNNFKGTKKGAN